MKRQRSHSTSIIVALAFCFISGSVFADSPKSKSSSAHLSYHWHLHQPIYWPASLPGAGRVQFAAESYDIKKSGGGMYPGSSVPHPQNNLAQGDIGSYDPIFSVQDRIHAYQSGGKDSLATLLPYPDAGASISYSGSLMDNVWSWGREDRFGYSPSWNSGYREARSWRTSGGFSRADMVGFTYHHSLAPLLPKSVFRKELQIFKEAWKRAWKGSDSDFTRGYFPTETAFSERLIPILREEGYQWSIVANGHLARTARNYLDSDVAPHHSTSTWNTNPPNRADMTGPSIPAGKWWSGAIDGRGAKLPAPYAYQAHWARYVDPDTGKESKLVIVPMDDVLSYLNGYSMMGTQMIDQFIAPFNDPAKPSLVLFAHDGDNAWGGGFSYYQESVPGLANEATAKGYRMTTIDQFLADHPVAQNDVVHIEDGGWINPEGDWGDPQFVKWLYPPARSPEDAGFRENDPRTYIDIENGFSNSWRSWAVIMAGANVCETAEQIQGNVRSKNIQDPSNANAAEKAWHFYLAGLDSGFMYYGDSLDDEVKQSLALNEALPYAKQVIGSGSQDRTPPSLLPPQRWPYNPGGIGWGVTTRYRDVGMNGKPPHSRDFYVWSLIHDISGVKSATVFVRKSKTGARNRDNDLYRGGASVEEWIALPMNRRAIDPTFRGDPPNPNLNLFIQSAMIADHWWAKVTGFKNALVDYYVEAVDSRGNRTRTDISHVWVGEGN